MAAAGAEELFNGDGNSVSQVCDLPKPLDEPRNFPDSILESPGLLVNIWVPWRRSRGVQTSRFCDGEAPRVLLGHPLLHAHAPQPPSPSHFTYTAGSFLRPVLVQASPASRTALLSAFARRARAAGPLPHRTHPCLLTLGMV